VVGLGLPPKYVLDEMQFYEVDSLLDSYYLKHKDSWEQARLIAYMTARVNSKGDLSPDDIMKFHWEKDDKPIINEQEQNDIELEIKHLENILNNKS
jgi:hypothetical protein